MKQKAQVLLTSLLILLLLTGCAPRVADLEQVGEDERIVIKFSHVVAENTPKGHAARYFARLVKERTDGFVEVQVYPNSTLYKDGEEIEALQANNVQLIAPATAKMVEYFPPLLAFDLPFLFEDYTAAHNFLNSSAGNELLAGINKHKMLGLAMWDNGFKIMSANQPLVQVQDFRGLNFRIMGNPVLESQFTYLGANTTTLPFSEVYEALDNLVVQGAENPPSNFYSKKFYEVQNHVTISNHGYLGYVVLTNSEFWISLPEDIRKVLEATLEDVTQWQRELAMYLNEKDLGYIMDMEEIDIHILTEEEKLAWRKAILPMYDDFNYVLEEMTLP